MTIRSKRQRKLIVYQDESGEWRYKLVAGNGKVVGSSEEGFSRRAYAIRRAVKTYPDAALFGLDAKGNLVPLPPPA